MTVAVVDGNSGTRRELVRLLGQMPGISVAGEAEDSEGALRMVGDRRPDVVVTDVRWMAPDGEAFLRRLARSAPEAGIVVLTAYLSERERAGLREAGARAVLLKEIDSGRLVRTIRTVAARAMAGERRPEA